MSADHHVLVVTALPQTGALQELYHTTQAGEIGQETNLANGTRVIFKVGPESYYPH